MFIFNFFTSSSFLEGFLTVIEGATDVDDSYVVVVFNNDVRADSGVAFGNRFVGGNGARLDGIGEAVNYPVVALGD